MRTGGGKVRELEGARGLAHTHMQMHAPLRPAPITHPLTTHCTTYTISTACTHACTHKCSNAHAHTHQTRKHKP